MTNITAMMIRANDVHVWAWQLEENGKWGATCEMMKDGHIHCTLLSHTLPTFNTAEEAMDSMNHTVMRVREDKNNKNEVYNAYYK